MVSREVLNAGEEGRHRDYKESVRPMRVEGRRAREGRTTPIWLTEKRRGGIRVDTGLSQMGRGQLRDKGQYTLKEHTGSRLFSLPSFSQAPDPDLGPNKEMHKAERIRIYSQTTKFHNLKMPFNSLTHTKWKKEKVLLHRIEQLHILGTV